MSWLAPFRAHNFMGNYADDATVLTAIRNLKWDSTFNGSGDPQDGMVYYNTTSHEFRGYKNGSWANIGGSITASDVSIDKVGTPDADNVQEFIRSILGAGLIDGGNITDAGGGNINVSSGYGYIRTTDSQNGATVSFSFSASNGIEIPTDTIRFIGVEYNSGSPQVVVKTTSAWNDTTEFFLGHAINEGGTLFILNNPHKTLDSLTSMIRRFHLCDPCKRSEKDGGLTLGSTGTRNASVSGGIIYDRLNSFTITDIDTSVSDTFDSYYGTTKQGTGITQWDNANYNNGGVLTELTNNWYTTLWWYVSANSELVMAYGDGQFSSAAAAEASSAPASLPARLQYHAKLIGRFVIKKNAATPDSIASVFDSNLSYNLAADHGNLGGLTDDDHSIYAFLAGRSGGQTLIGGSESSENLTLQSTSNATRGSILISGDTLGITIPNTSDCVALQINQNDTTNNPIAFSVNNTGNGARIAVNTNEFLIEGDGTISVAGVPNYETLVTDDDDIPNKKYVDDSVGSSIADPWIAGPAFTRSSDSTFTVTDNADNQAIFVEGRPIKYRATAGTWYYGIVTDYTTGTVTLAGVAMTTDRDDEIAYSGTERVDQVDVLIGGQFADADDSSLIANDLNSALRWNKAAAYIVQVNHKVDQEDSGATNPAINVTIGGSDVLTADDTVSNTWQSSVVDIDTANYALSRGDDIEISVAASGTNDDSSDLTVSLIIVMA